jgi:hypothetical protein
MQTCRVTWQKIAPFVIAAESSHARRARTRHSAGELKGIPTFGQPPEETLADAAGAATARRPPLAVVGAGLELVHLGGFQLVHASARPAPDFECAGVLGRVKVTLAARGAYGPLTRPPRSRNGRSYQGLAVDQCLGAGLDQFLSGFDTAVAAARR